MNAIHPTDLAQHFETYLQGLLHLERIPVEHRTAELAKVAMVLNQLAVDVCTECTPACPLRPDCPRRRPPLPEPYHPPQSLLRTP